jgi:hypothetical protein
LALPVINEKWHKLFLQGLSAVLLLTEKMNKFLHFPKTNPKN